ncbi:chorismate synthase [Wolbachia pipientis]|uniref:Chorismate synthase n=1 Tax=Wolbachia pipientis TaxID=955 RepID=A0A1E7QLC0_WOLPI|nr:DnaA/Hda family protein [Wolbachia pipientis]OEY87207.1 chorismate synthase [Wolbachia pipientis]
MQLNLFNNNHYADYSQHNYIILNENKYVYDAVVNNASWKSLLLFGPKSSGKTHLAHIWKSVNNAIFININNFISDMRYSDAFILENIHNIQDETSLLHCYNYMKESNKKMLITSAISPTGLNFKLKDLHSRILSTTSVKIPPASEDLLRIMLIKRFADKQLKIDSKVIDYILSRIERSFYSINRITEEIDNKSVGMAITIPFISSLLRELN